MGSDSQSTKRRWFSCDMFRNYFSNAEAHRAFKGRTPKNAADAWEAQEACQCSFILFVFCFPAHSPPPRPIGSLPWEAPLESLAPAGREGVEVK
jgi:hypothetical protein